ncbi:hypothetical protein Dsin_005145 [Dipteronia sinensis]|uniref:Uncharacterized protein n=1 Tax=Dipteronia sinensis TaxID=43782 RepID=A0AAE0AW25_9ROSI|nr:hypothetical protein Dsin_005145 [Dipteronia sinensis]
MGSGSGRSSGACYGNRRKMVEDENQKAKRIDEMKVEKLRRNVPGGEMLVDDDQLLVHTADYILFLKNQLHVLETILKLHHHHHHHQP